MKIQQLRYAVEVARRGLNVSDAAEALHTSQPGVSKQIRLLEGELGVDIFERHGKRVVAVTEPGRAVLAIAERILGEAANLKRAGEEFANEASGSLRIATTHTQARYALPQIVRRFKQAFPKVHLVLHQASPAEIVALLQWARPTSASRPRRSMATTRRWRISRAFRSTTGTTSSSCPTATR